MADAQPNEPNEPSPRERIERGKALALRARQYWKGSLVIFILGCAISVLAALQMKRMYSSEAVVLIKPAMKTDDQETPQERAVRLVPKLRDTLLTRARLEPIITEFNLYPKTVESKGMVAAVLEMKNHIGNLKARDSETFVVSFEDEDPDRARIITQRLADTTLADFKRANMASKQTESDFLGSELARAEKDLEDANRALASFLATHPEFAAADALNSPFANQFGARPGMMPQPQATPQVPTSTDPQLATLYRQKARLEAELKAAATGAPPPPNETVASLTRARDDAAKRAAQAQADLADKRTKLTDQHPDMVSAKAQAENAANALRAAESQLDAAKKAAAGAAPSNPTADLNAKLTELSGEIRARQAELAKAGSAGTPTPATPGSAAAGKTIDTTHPVVAMEIEWARLLRAVGDARAVQEDIRRRAERARLKASASEITGRDQLEIIDPAYKPLQPKKGRRDRALIGLVMSLFVALAYAASRTLLNDRIYDAGDIEAMRLVPVLGVIPRLPPASTDASQSTAMQAQGPQGVSRVG